ncbi:MAG: type I restriction-modification system subunit M [Butyrivibrio sp.]|uniref:type I restriction-modification system subunit M n=1 Tax=Butyrivibrio sp. TaxID=28121 RepID=UPI001B4014AB|nr:type I restriction-modification system subunit M [Butyrivibrio sp.]MBP3782273.1 type I restriction-modification system subunit M [Butyrivibrio sp.]
MNKQQLAAKIWESANQMRSKIEANEYKDYILGFIFYKFLSEKEERYLLGLGYTREDMDTVTEDDTEVMEDVQKNIGYFISYPNLFSTWLKKGVDFNVADVRDALSAFERCINPIQKKVFENIFETLSVGLSKLGDTAANQTKAISELIRLIADIPMDGKQDYDVLGFIYEYLISNFAANAGKKAGEFYTPHEVSILMSEIVANHLKDRSEIEIFDPTSGSGSLLINIGKSIAKYLGDSDKIKYYAQELKQNTYNLTRMNLVMRGILPSNIFTRNGDTLEEDWPYFDENDRIGTYKPLYVDAVVSNPPYSQKWDPSDKESDPRYKEYGLAPKGKADYAFLLHDLYHIKPDGIMTIVLPHGVLFRGGEEGTIRKNLIENNKIDAIIGLPANIFFGTGIPTIIMVLKQKRENTDVLIIDASKGFEKVGKNNKLRACDIKKIVDAVTGRLTIDGFSRLVERSTIRENDYNLNIPRYVDSSEQPEKWDIYASMFGGIPKTEVDELAGYWDAFPGLRNDLFVSASDQYLAFINANIKNIINDHEDIRNFVSSYKDAFDGLDTFLVQELIDGQDSLTIAAEEEVISTEIFKRFEGLKLGDPYEAYQIVDDMWSQISIDLEIIQTEGRDAIRKVDPNMVTKKKNGKEVEVQEGYIGHIFPFELVQKSLLKDRKEEIGSLDGRLSEISSEYEELLESLSEEDKEAAFVNEDKTEFVFKEVTKAIKDKDVEGETLTILKKADALNKEEKSLKKQIKDKTVELELATKDKIESLSDAEVRMLFEKKWIDPITEGIADIPAQIVKSLISRLEAIAEKYETTYEEVDKEIRDTSSDLVEMLGLLTGNEFDMQGVAELQKLLGGE